MRLCTFILIASASVFPQGSSTSQVDQLLAHGFAAAATGNYPEMARSGAEALQLSTAAHDKRRIASSLLLVGSADYYQGQLLETFDLIQQADGIASALDDIPLQKRAERALGDTERQLGHYDQALRHFETWFRLNRQLAHPEPEGPMIRTVGILYREMGDLDKAESTCREALKLARTSGDRRFEAATLLSLGGLAKDRTQYRAALSLFRQALPLAEAVHAFDLQAEILNSLGDLYTQLGEPTQASECLNTAVKLAESIGYHGLQAQASERLGQIEQFRAHYSQAVQLFARADSLYRVNGDIPEKRFHVEQLWARAERSLGHREQALSHYQEAIGLLEQLERFTVPAEMERALPIAESREVFEEAVDLLIELNRPNEAFETAERGRARAFLDVLNESKIDLRSTLTSAERSREEELSLQVAASRNRPQALAAALSALEAFYLELRRSDPAYAQLRRPVLASARLVQTGLTGGGTMFLEYMLGDRRSFAWAISADRIQFASLPPRREIQALVEAYRASLTADVTALTARSLQTREDRQSRALYRILISPFTESTPGTKHFLIAADGVLAYVPFEALLETRGREYLIERYSVSYTQSASAAVALRAMHQNAPLPPNALLAIGDANYGSATHPDQRDGTTWMPLPYTHREILDIANFYPPARRALYFGAEATEAQLKRQNLRDYRYLHFAVHGLVDEDNPERSGLVLSADPKSSEDGILRMEEIALLRTNAELVTLSACRTGVGRLLRGEGLMALSRAFFYAGAHTVIATVWDVNDLSTAAFMQKLYFELDKNQSPEKALRQAKLCLLHGNQSLWRDPHFWAPFVMFE